MLIKQQLLTFSYYKKNTFIFLACTLCLVLTPKISYASLITFINEIHYDNSGGDENEFVEIASLTTTDLSTLAILLYNGDSRTQYKSKALSSYTFTNIINGYGFIKVNIQGIQNGLADGIALVNTSTSNVLQFISYEGVLIATNGIANGMGSIDIGVKETSSTALNFSLQLGGSGSYYEDFSWQEAQLNTASSVNTHQSFINITNSNQPLSVQVPEPNTQYLLMFSLLWIIYPKINRLNKSLPNSV